MNGRKFFINVAAVVTASVLVIPVSLLAGVAAILNCLRSFPIEVLGIYDEIFFNDEEP